MAHTEHRIQVTDSRTSKRSERAFSIGVILMIAVLLAACSGSKASDSRRAQSQDATKGAVVPGLQATKIVKDFFPPTPTPGPTMTPMATIASLRLATQIGSTGEPVDSISHASPGQQIYAAAQLSHLRKGEIVAAKWFNSTGALMAETDQTVGSDMDSAWVALPWTVDPSAFGNCWVEVWVNRVKGADDTKMNSIVFSAG